MKFQTRKLRSPLKWHGGKSYLARRIVALMPEHRTYVEPFLGGGSVLLNKPQSEYECAGDLNGDLVNFWETLARSPIALGMHLAAMPYTEGVFREALGDLNAMNDVVAAGGFLIRNRFSRGGLGRDFAWSERLRGGQPGDANAWGTIRADLPAIADRVRGVWFQEIAAEVAIRRFDNPDTLIYCDPPYLHETRTAKKAYAHEMTREQHESFLDLILNCDAAVMVSGYRSALYDEALAGWTRHDFDMPNHSGQGKAKQRRTECLWINRKEEA